MQPQASACAKIGSRQDISQDISNDGNLIPKYLKLAPNEVSGSQASAWEPTF
jgi:hypothetical protein